jgi:hypothetical protein
MPDEQSNNRQNDVQEESIVVSAEMVQDIVKEIIELEQDHLYVNRANLKEQIVTLIKTKVR